MRILWMMTVLGLAACQPTPQAAPVAVAAQTAVAGTSMVSLLNRERAAQGRGVLVENARLSRAARIHAQDMVSNNYFSHDSLDGSSFSDRARAAGYTCAAGENIALGQRSEAEVVGEWMTSPGHRSNILLGDAKEFGIGRIGNMWVLIFGRGC